MIAVAPDLGVVLVILAVPAAIIFGVIRAVTRKSRPK